MKRTGALIALAALTMGAAAAAANTQWSSFVKEGAFGKTEAMAIGATSGGLGLVIVCEDDRLLLAVTSPERWEAEMRRINARGVMLRISIDGGTAIELRATIDGTIHGNVVVRGTGEVDGLAAKMAAARKTIDFAALVGDTTIYIDRLGTGMAKASIGKIIRACKPVRP